VGLLLAAFPAAAIAQEEPPAEPERATIDLAVDEVDISAYPDVTVTVTVPFELAGASFTLDDFYVAENGAARPVSVEQVPGDRLAVVLVLDTSGSMRGAPLTEAKAAVVSFVDQMPPGVAFALVRFGSTSELVVPFTTDPAEVRDAVGGLVAGGETALYDALTEAGTLYEGLGDVRRSLILLSDGGDTASEATLEQGIVSLLTAQAAFVAVELQSPENDPEALQRLQVSAEGQIVAASNPGALEGIFSELASDLLNQFRISFTAEGGGPTELTVAVRGEDVAAVSTSSVRLPDPPPVVTTAPPPTTVPPTTSTPVEVAAPVLTGQTVALPWYQTSGGLTIAAAAIFLGLFGVFALARPERTSGGIVALRGIARSTRDRNVLSGLADRASGFAEEALTRRGGGGGVRLLLDQAGLNLRIGEFAIVALAAVLVGFFVGNLGAGFLGGAIGAAIGGLLPPALVSAVGTRRAQRFQQQLPDTLQLIAGALRAGFGINQAIDGVVAESPEPAASEFGRVRLEVQLGRELEDALALMAERVQSEDLRMAAEAIEIHRQVGGDLAELLERVSSTIREREMIRRQIQVLSAEGRISALVLVAMPIVIAAVVRVIAPDYMTELTSTGVGQVLIVAGIVLLIVGMVWIRRIVQLRF
jgi:tight adherence protein B